VVNDLLIDRAAMQLCRPDLAALPDYDDEKRQRRGRPYWFQRIVWDCQTAARGRAHVVAYLSSDGYYGPIYDEAVYLESYAESFPKLLAEALATREV
jgi:hypothetical protein